MFRRYIESLVVVLAPWVLLTEQEAKEVEVEKNCLCDGAPAYQPCGPHCKYPYMDGGGLL